MTLKPIMTAAALAALLAGCGPKALTLAEDPIDRAATCGIVAAADARKSGGTAAGALPIDKQLGVMHYALLAAAGDDGFDRDRAAAVAKRMPELEAGVTRGKWQELVQPCAAAFPQTQVAEVTLPGERLHAQLGCYALADFLQESLQRQGASYGEELNRYGDLKRALDGRIGAGVARTGAGTAETQALRKTAFSEVVRAGPLGKVMTRCLERFAPAA